MVSSGLGKAECEQSIRPKNNAGRDEDRYEDFNFGNDGCPENVQIADLGKPQPIYQEANYELQQNEADQKDNADDDECP